MNLQEFLQLENEKFAEAMIDKDDWFLSDHDTRLINKVLQLVQEEVGKKLSHSNSCNAHCDCECNQAHTHFDINDCDCDINKISTIINNLKIK